MPSTIDEAISVGQEVKPTYAWFNGSVDATCWATPSSPASGRPEPPQACGRTAGSPSR